MADPTRYAVSTNPTNGETPLTTAPAWGGRGGGDQAAKVYAFQAFAKQFGRNPTQSELTMLAPAFIGTDPNIAAVSQGESAVAQYFQGFHNTPTEINKQEGQKNLEEAPNHFGDVTQQFQSVLGRAPTQDELNHFGSLLASGTTDAYGIQNFLQQQPEYTDKKNQTYQDKLKAENQAAQDKVAAQNQSLQDQMRAGNQDFQAQARQGNEAFQTNAQAKIKAFGADTEAKNKAYQDQLSGQLAGYDKRYFGEQILPSIQQAYAKQGRSFDSSAFQNAATQSAQQQNTQREQYLASLSAGQYNTLQQQQAAMQAGLQDTSAAQYGNLQNVSAGQYGTLQQQQAAQQAYLQNQTAAQQGFVQNLGANQYGGMQQNAYQDYANQVANQQNLTNSGINAQYQGVQNTQNRLNQIQDFNTQSQMYNQYLAKYGKRNNGLGGAIGGVVGGGIGAFFGGPAGAMAGFQMGNSLGTAGQNYAGGSY